MSGRTVPAPERVAGVDGDAATALQVESLRKVYGDGPDAVRAVEDVSFEVEEGTVVGLLGPNGAGKTTLIKCILGLVVPTAGTVRVGGTDVSTQGRETYGHVSAMLEGARNVYWKLTVRENLEFFAALSGVDPAERRERHDRLLEQFSLSEKADTPVNDLSRGMKQKVALAATLARETDVAFLDEPTLGLDVESSLELRRELRRLAEEEDLTILLSSHDMDVIEDVCDRVIVMDDGEVVADDAVEELLDLFRTQAYQVTVDGELRERTRQTLRTAHGAEGFERRGDRETFSVTLGEDRSVYDLMDALRASGLTVRGIESIDPDLESVFVELVGGEEA